MEQQHLDAYGRVKGDLIRSSRQVAERGFSYRGFKVGCAVFVWRPKGVGLTERYRVFKAANAKPLKTGQKFCGEMTAVCYARSNGFERVIAIAVAGLPQADDGSGIEPQTLHPCEVCRPFLASLPEVSRDTIILSVHNHSGKVEEHTLEEILRIHGNDIPWEVEND